MQLYLVITLKMMYNIITNIKSKGRYTTMTELERTQLTEALTELYRRIEGVSADERGKHIAALNIVSRQSERTLELTRKAAMALIRYAK